MTTGLPKPPVLFVKLPRHVVDSLQTARPSDLRLTLGGKERITTGTLWVGEGQHDVRFSSERSSAPPLLFQGRMAAEAAESDGWAPWTQRGKLLGKLTVLHKQKAAASAASSDKQPARASVTMATDDADHGRATARSDAQRGPADMAGGAEVRAAPQKKPGIFRQNREMLRDRVLHMLARGPMDETELLDQIKSPQNVVLDVLGTLARKSQKAEWSLLPDKFRLVQVETWPGFTASTRGRVARNALDAFDALEVAEDDPDRVRIKQVLQRGSQAPGQPAKDAVSALKESPTAKKKAARPGGALSLTKKLRLEAAKSVKRMMGPTGGMGSSAPPTATGSAAPEGSVSPRERAGNGTDQPKAPAARPGRPTPLPVASGGKLRSARDSEDDSARRQMASAPNTAADGGFGHAKTSSIGSALGRQHVRKEPRYQKRDGSDHAASDAEAEYRPSSQLRKYGSAASPRRQRRASGRSHSRGSHISPEPDDGDSERHRWHQHRRVKSRPIQLQSLANAPGMGMMSRTPDAEMGAAVSRVQERLAQEMGDRRQQRPAGPKSRSRSSSDSARPSIYQRPRGPSLSPIADVLGSPTPLISSQIEPPETIEDLEELQERLVSAYAEYSQLRHRIDGVSATFDLLASELAEARESWLSATAERRRSEAEREEGEEVPGTVADVELGLTAPVDKCAPDGSRLYWAEASGDPAAWLADGPEAAPGQRTGRDGLPCRTQPLLPEEARLLRATRAVTEQYALLDGDDARRCVARYLHAHAHVAALDKELRAAHRRIADEINAQYESFRDDLGDSDVDAARHAATASPEPPAHVLSLDIRQDAEPASM
ncbi:hypothetical protein GGF46_002837 [Coemansia sp. RSA 552]|nr:hypothetical protein GGF46_002837 [Coemansia sp. RSA 552]